MGSLRGKRFPLIAQLLVDFLDFTVESLDLEGEGENLEFIGEFKAFLGENEFIGFEGTYGGVIFIFSVKITAARC